MADDVMPAQEQAAHYADPALLARLMRPVSRPGLIQVRQAYRIVGRIEAMLAGNPLSERLARRMHVDDAGDDLPLVYARPAPSSAAASVVGPGNWALQPAERRPIQPNAMAFQGAAPSVAQSVPARPAEDRPAAPPGPAAQETRAVSADRSASGPTRPAGIAAPGVVQRRLRPGAAPARQNPSSTPVPVVRVGRPATPAIHVADPARPRRGLPAHAGQSALPGSVRDQGSATDARPVAEPPWALPSMQPAPQPQTAAPVVRVRPAPPAWAAIVMEAAASPSSQPPAPAVSPQVGVMLDNQSSLPVVAAGAAVTRPASDQYHLRQALVLAQTTQGAALTALQAHAAPQAAGRILERSAQPAPTSPPPTAQADAAAVQPAPGVPNPRAIVRQVERRFRQTLRIEAERRGEPR